MRTTKNYEGNESTNKNDIIKKILKIVIYCERKVPIQYDLSFEVLNHIICCTLTRANDLAVSL